MNQQNPPQIFPSHPDLLFTNLKAWNSDQVMDLYLAGSDSALSSDSDRKQHSPDSLDSSIYQQKAPGPLVIDCQGKILAPGLRDPHVHFRDPGQTYKETMISGAQAAARGGYTGLLIMPNTVPALDGAPVTGGVEGYRTSLDYLNHYQEAQSCLLPVKYALCLAASQGRQGKKASSFHDWEESLTWSSHPALALSDDGAAVPDDLLSHVAALALKAGIIFIDHCEHHEQGIMNESDTSRTLGVPGIPGSTEIAVVSRDIQVAKETGVHIHLQHISTKASVEAIRKAKAEGLAVTCETAPHYLALNDRALLTYGAMAKMNPPLRSEADRQALLEAVADGTIDMIATDHAPHSLEEKEAGLMEAPNGIIGLETAYPVLHTLLVDGGIISDNRLIDLMSVQPARLLGQNVYDPLAHLSSQEEGNPVCDLKSWSYSFDDPWAGQAPDLVILDTDKTWTIEAKDFLSKARNTPFDQWTVTGKAMATILSGSLSYASSELMAILAKKEDSWTD